jgi:hypothetical protein
MSTLLFPFQVAIAGVSWHQEAVTDAHLGQHVVVVSEPDNPYDANARRVEVEGMVVGHLPRAVAQRLADEGVGLLEGEVVDIYCPPGASVRGMRVSLHQPATPVTTCTSQPLTTNVQDPADDTCNDAGGTEHETLSDRAVVRVRASGRVLGHLVSRDETGVIVDTGTSELRVPLAVVEIEPVSSPAAV